MAKPHEQEWKVYGLLNSAGQVAITEADGRMVCATRANDGDALAPLIAAAPRLYRELAHLVRLLESLEKDGGLEVPGLATLNGARMALRKADGQ